MHNCKKDDHQENHKLFFISEKTSSRSFFTIDCEAPHKKVPCSRPLPPFEAGALQICERTFGHGLVCLWVHPDIILWNPLTTEYKKLPSMDNMDWYSLVNGGLYYSSSEDDYKLVLVATYGGNAYTYSLKSDSWRMVTNIKLDGFWELCVSSNDNLYFLSRNEKKPCSIVRFDTTAETFKKIETPSVNDDNKPHSATITVHRGYVHYCVKYDIGRPGFLKSTCIELWKLNADEVAFLCHLINI
ncbi:putative F-box domain-containing protein [Tanacetum coccineum]